MESITGFSRRGLIGLTLAVALGVAASTVAGSIATRGQPGCPDLAYRCATFEAGEPIVLGALFPEANGTEARALRQVVEQHGAINGRPVEVASWRTACTPEGATNGARELATDPPDGPPVVAVIGGSCRQAAVPAAQILSNSGITLLLPTSVRVADTVGPTPYALRVMPGADASSIVDAVELILRTAANLSLDGEDGELLIPRTPLRDALAHAFDEPVR